MNREDGSAFGIRRWAFGRDASTSRTPTLALLLLAAALQIGVVVWRFDQMTVDRDAYLGIATNLVEGRGFSTPGTTTPTAYRPPLYPLILAAAMSVLPPAWAVAAVNVAAGLMTVWLVLQLGHRLGLGRVRFVAGVMTAVNPLLLYAMPQPMTEAVFTALTTAWWWAVVRSQNSERRFDHFIAGVLFGLAALCRPTIWPLVGLMALAWIVTRIVPFLLARGRTPESESTSVKRSPLLPSPLPRGGGEGTGIWAASLVILGTLLVVAPWVIRNQLVFGRPILTTTHGGYTLLLANNPVHDTEVVRQPWGASWPGESLDRWQRELHQWLDSEVGPKADEVTQDRWMSQLAKEDIKHRPDRFFAAMLHRVRSLWSITPRGEGTSAPFALRGPIAAFFAVEFLLAIIGIWIVFRCGEWRAWLPGLLMIVTIQAVHLAYWTDTRMRTPLEPVLALLAARALCALSPRPRLGGEG